MGILVLIELDPSDGQECLPIIGSSLKPRFGKFNDQLWGVVLPFLYAPTYTPDPSLGVSTPNPPYEWCTFVYNLVEILQSKWEF